MAGLAPSAAQLNNVVGNQALALDQVFNQIARVCRYLASIGGGSIATPANATAAIAALQAAPVSMAAADATALVNAYVRLLQLYAIYTGNTTLGTARDFSADVLTLIGSST